MGAWGPGIFSSDTALDVRDTYVEKLKMGASDEEALEYVQSELSEYLEDEEDAIDFWLSLSSILFDYGRLTADIKSKALQIIEKGDDYRWQSSEIKKRAKALELLKDKLLSNQPERKTIKALKPVKCKFIPGDVLLYKLQSLKCTQKEYCNWFFYILIDDVVVFDTRIEGLGDTYPIVCIKYSDHELKDLSELDDMDYVRTQGNNIKEHRIQLYRDGYKDFIKQCKYLGNYKFVRPENVYEKQVFIMRPAREIDSVICQYLDYKHDKNR